MAAGRLSSGLFKEKDIEVGGACAGEGPGGDDVVGGCCRVSDGFRGLEILPSSGGTKNWAKGCHAY